MKQLIARIDAKKKTISFFGPGTFDAKEAIKELGPARWNGDAKEWVLPTSSVSIEELKQAFPALVIENESETLGEETAVEESADEAIEPETLTSAVNVIPGDPSAVPSGISVSQFLARASQALSKAFPQTICIHGVLKTVKRYGPRIYMDLVEPEKTDQAVSCVIWSGEKKLCAGLEKAGFSLEEDLHVMFEVQVGMNVKRGSISLTVVRIVEEFTIAKLAAQRELTNKRLQAEGIFALNKGLALPFLPRRLGILTSTGGTVINDFRNSLDQSRFGFELFWIHVGVQGKAAQKSIVGGIRQLAQYPELDVILLFRGGGSASDLAVFNEYEVAKAICESPLPVFSAIGHQEDQSSTQDVSNQAFGVPKDLGRFFADIVEGHRVALSGFAQTIVTIATERCDATEERLLSIHTSIPVLTNSCINRASQLLRDRIGPVCALGLGSVELHRKSLQSLKRELEFRSSTIRTQAQESLKHAVRRVRDTVASRVKEFELRVEHVSSLVAEASPEVQLRRGFTLIRKQGTEEHVLSAADVASGEAVEIDFHDSSRRATIT